MFAVYAKEANFEDPLASVVVDERPDPIVEGGWVRVKVTHASLNRHDIFTLRGLTAQEQPIPFPMILGNDGAGLLDDGTPVVIYPVMGTDRWRGDEMIDPHWHVLSELVAGRRQIMSLFQSATRCLFLEVCRRSTHRCLVRPGSRLIARFSPNHD